MEFLQPALVIENCAIATMDGRQHDDTGAEHRSGHIIMSGGWSPGPDSRPGLQPEHITAT